MLIDGFLDFAFPHNKCWKEASLVARLLRPKLPSLGETRSQRDSKGHTVFLVSYSPVSCTIKGLSSFLSCMHGNLSIVCHTMEFRSPIYGWGNPTLFMHASKDINRSCYHLVNTLADANVKTNGTSLNITNWLFCVLFQQIYKTQILYLAI